MSPPRARLFSRRGHMIGAAFAFCWIGIGLILWLRTLWGPGQQWPPGVATCVIVQAILFSMLLRIRVLLSDTWPTHRASDRWLLLLADLGLINYVGAAVIRAASGPEATGSLASLLAAEWWFARQLNLQRFDRWEHVRLGLQAADDAFQSLRNIVLFHASRRRESQRSASVFPRSSQPGCGDQGDGNQGDLNRASSEISREQTSSGSVPAEESEKRTEATPTVQETVDVEADSACQILSPAGSPTGEDLQSDTDDMDGKGASQSHRWKLIDLTEGVDANGCRFVSGVLAVHFEPSQRQVSVGVAIPMPFERPAAVELEPMHEDVKVKLTRATETGFRLLARRSMDDLALTVEIEFYASEPVVGGDMDVGVNSGNQGNADLP